MAKSHPEFRCTQFFVDKLPCIEGNGKVHEHKENLVPIVDLPISAQMKSKE